MRLPFPLTPLLLILLLFAPAAPLHANDEADRQFTFAARLMQQGERELAEEAFDEFIADFGDDRRVSDAHYYLALLARQAGEHERARRHLARVDELHQVAAASLHLLRGQLALEEDDADQAIDHLEQINADDFDDTESRAAYHYLLATAYRAADNLDGAASHFDRASDAASAVRATALLELGKTRMRLNQPTAALEALRSALDEPIPSAQAAEARYLAASLAYDQRQYEMAIHFYEQVTRQHQGSEHYRPAVIGLLRALGAAGEEEELVERYESSRSQLAAADQPEARYLLASAHARLEEFERATEILRDLQRRFGDDHAFANQVAYLRAVCLYRTDLAAFERYLRELESSDTDAADRAELRYLRAQAAVRRERPADAIDHLTPLIERDDSSYARRALRQRAALNRELGRTGDAASDYALFARRYEDDPAAEDAARRAVDLAYRAGRFAEVPDLAADYLQRVEEDEEVENVAAIRLRAAAALMQLDQPERAMDELDRLLAADPPERLATLGHYYRGLLLAARAQADDGDEADAADPAVAALERALEGSLSDQQRAEATNLLARMHRMAGRESEALDLYDELRRSRPVDEFDPLAALWIGRGLHERGSYESALPWLETVIERGEDEPAAVAEALYLAGQAHHELEDYDAAITRFRQVVAFSQGYGDRGRLGLARALAAAGEVDEALNEYEGLLHVEASEVAAAALLESAQQQIRLAERLERGGDSSGEQEALTEARRRLNRVVILYDLPELGHVPHLARLYLARLLARQDRADNARDRLEELADRSDAGPFRDLARAELEVLNSARGDARFLLRRVVEEDADDHAAAADYARDRLDELGEAR